MFNIEFYEDKNGFSELNDELIELAKKAEIEKAIKECNDYKIRNGGK